MHVSPKGVYYSHMTMRRKKSSLNFAFYVSQMIENYKKIGRQRMAEKYKATLRSFLLYLDGREVSLEEFDDSLVVGYESWLKGRGLCRNTTSFYMRNLRAIYNHAVEKGLAVSSKPFRHVYTGVDKTCKRALPLSAIKKIKEIDLSDEPKLDYARDIFLFSFYTRGMSFIDMAYLRKKDLCGGILHYRRQKTSQQLSIKWEKPMQEILDKYDTESSPWLLPIVQKEGADVRTQYKSVYRSVNRWLKTLGKRLRLPIPLTTYVARHTWASAAHRKNIPIATISEALGHDSESTTQIYLSSIDNSLVDKANKLIIYSL